jgi:hypothetical protein
LAYTLMIKLRRLGLNIVVAYELPAHQRDWVLEVAIKHVPQRRDATADSVRRQARRVA